MQTNAGCNLNWHILGSDMSGFDSYIDRFSGLLLHTNWRGIHSHGKSYRLHYYPWADV